MLYDVVQSMIEELTALQRDLLTVEGDQECGCTPTSTCKLCLAENHIKQFLALGMTWDMEQLERKVRAETCYKARNTDVAAIAWKGVDHV